MLPELNRFSLGKKMILQLVRLCIGNRVLSLTH